MKKGFLMEWLVSIVLVALVLYGAIGLCSVLARLTVMAAENPSASMGNMARVVISTALLWPWWLAAKTRETYDESSPES